MLCYITPCNFVYLQEMITRWRKSEKPYACWKQLLTAIHTPYGGQNPALANDLCAELGMTTLKYTHYLQHSTFYMDSVQGKYYREGLFIVYYKLICVTLMRR